MPVGAKKRRRAPARSEILFPAPLWKRLRAVRLREGIPPEVASLLDGVPPDTGASPPAVAVTLRRVDLTGCATFQDVNDAFAATLPLAHRIGDGADALYDVLNDLSTGRHLFLLDGTRRLPPPLRTLLRRALALEREAGGGYGEGEAVLLVSS